MTIIALTYGTIYGKLYQPLDQNTIHPLSKGLVLKEEITILYRLAKDWTVALQVKVTISLSEYFFSKDKTVRDTMKCHVMS